MLVCLLFAHFSKFSMYAVREKKRKNVSLLGVYVCVKAKLTLTVIFSFFIFCTFPFGRIHFWKILFGKMQLERIQFKGMHLSLHTPREAFKPPFSPRSICASIHPEKQLSLHSPPEAFEPQYTVRSLCGRSVMVQRRRQSENLTLWPTDQPTNQPSDRGRFLRHLGV